VSIGRTKEVLTSIVTLQYLQVAIPRPLTHALMPPHMMNANISTSPK
jgi:hypothetical protein